MNDQDKDFTDIFEEWKRHNRASHFEGCSGVRKLEKFCEDLGYRDGQFIGSEVSIQNFLADNPGAIEALLEWVCNLDNDEWKENLISTLPEEGEEEEDDE